MWAGNFPVVSRGLWNSLSIMKLSPLALETLLCTTRRTSPTAQEGHGLPWTSGRLCLGNAQHRGYAGNSSIVMTVSGLDLFFPKDIFAIPNMCSVLSLEDRVRLSWQPHTVWVDRERKMRGLALHVGRTLITHWAAPLLSLRPKDPTCSLI